MPRDAVARRESSLSDRLRRAACRTADRALAMARRSGLGNRYPLRVADYTVTVAGWAPSTGVTAVALADLHFGGSYLDQGRLELVLERTVALDPDLVLLLGDYGASHLQGESHRRAMRTLASSLQRLQPPLGVFAVLGNHDWWDDPGAQDPAGTRAPIIAAQELSSAGVTVLENQAILLGRDDARFWLAGLGDQWAYKGPPMRGVDDLPLLTGQLDEKTPAILLAHEPDIFPAVPDRYALTLSGHTHAGQIRLFGRTPVVPSRFGSRYVHGRIVEDGRHLIVSAGLGTTALPVRIGTRPEFVRIVLTS